MRRSRHQRGRRRAPLHCVVPSRSTGPGRHHPGRGCYLAVAMVDRRAADCSEPRQHLGHRPRPATTSTESAPPAEPANGRASARGGAQPRQSRDHPSRDHEEARVTNGSTNHGGGRRRPGCRCRARRVLLVDETVSSAPTPPSPRSRRQWTPRSPATWTRCVPAPTQSRWWSKGFRSHSADTGSPPEELDGSRYKKTSPCDRLEPRSWAAPRPTPGSHAGQGARHRRAHRLWIGVQPRVSRRGHPVPCSAIRFQALLGCRPVKSYLSTIRSATRCGWSTWT